MTGDTYTHRPDGLVVHVMTSNGAEAWPVESVELETTPAGVELVAFLVRSSDGRLLSLATTPGATAGTVDDITLVGFGTPD